MYVIVHQMRPSEETWEAPGNKMSYANGLDTVAHVDPRLRIF